MSRGEFEYSGAYKNQYNFFQLGYDKAFGSWHYGAAISHNDGKTTYDSGKGENKSTSCHFMEPGWVTEDIILILF